MDELNMKDKILAKLASLLTKRIVRSEIYLAGFIEGALFVGAISKKECYELKRDLEVDKEYYVHGRRDML
jgi:hypothetical protein